jgi:hypothetical protein
MPASRAHRQITTKIYLFVLDVTRDVAQSEIPEENTIIYGSDRPQN